MISTAGSASSASTGTRRNAEFRRARLRRRRIGVGERDEVEDRELSRRSQIGGADVSATDDADSDRSHHDLSELRGGRFADRRWPSRSPRRAVEIAQRHRGRALHPVSVAPFANDDVGDVREARRKESGDGLAQRLDEMVAGRHGAPGNDDLRRREQRDEARDGEAQRLARGGEHPRAALVARRPRASTETPSRVPDEASRQARSRACSASASISTDASEAMSASRSPPPSRRPNHEIAEVRAEAVRAAKQFAVVKNAETKAALDVHDEEVVEIARLSEPVLGEGHEIDVAVDRSGHAKAMAEIRAEGHVALLKNWALSTNARRPSRQRQEDRRRRPRFERCRGPRR